MGNVESAFGVRINDQITVVAMDDPDPVAAGTGGTVIWICDTPGFEQIGVDWENGRTLALIPGVDSWTVR